MMGGKLGDMQKHDCRLPGDMRKASGTNYAVDRITTPVEK